MRIKAYKTEHGVYGLTIGDGIENRIELGLVVSVTVASHMAIGCSMQYIAEPWVKEME